MIPKVGAQGCAPRKNVGRQSRVGSSLTAVGAFQIKTVASLQLHACNVWNSNEEMAPALNFPARVGAFYVTRRRGQGSLIRDSTLVYKKTTFKMYGVNSTKHHVDSRDKGDLGICLSRICSVPLRSPAVSAGLAFALFIA
jgi:hypothetical protein